MTFKEGLELVKSGYYEAAVPVLRGVTRTDALHHKAWNTLGFALTRLGRYDEADDCFQAALRIKPDDPVYLKNRDVNAKKRGTRPLVQTSSASPLPEGKKVKDKPKDNTLIIILGFVFFLMIAGGSLILLGMNSGMFTSNNAPVIPDQTILPTVIPTVVVQDGAQYERFCTEGNELIRQGQPESAFRSFENATRIDPTAPKAWTGMGYAMIELGRYVSAIESFDTALKLDPGYQDALVGRQIATEANTQPLIGESPQTPAPVSNCPQCTAGK